MKIKFNKPKFKTISLTNNEATGEFVLSNLNRGFATTLGNGIRRTLISSIVGAAVYAVQIEGIKHEFQSIAGVEEDVVKIILNLKKLILKISDDEPVVLKLNAKTTGPVKASDLVCPVGVEILSPDLVIAHIAKGGNLEMAIHAQNGRGYATNDENKAFSTTIGLIAIDSNYSPIRAVNFNVKEIHTTKLDMLEKLILQIDTDGSISAKKALEESAQILISYLLLLTDVEKLEEIETVISQEVVQPKNKSLEMTLEELDFSQRSYNALRRAGYTRLGEIAQLTKQKIREIKNLGKKSIDEVEEKLHEKGLRFKD